MVRTGKKEGNKFLPVNSSRFEAGDTGKKEGNKFLPVNSSRFETGNTGKKGGSQILPVYTAIFDIKKKHLFTDKKFFNLCIDLTVNCNDRVILQGGSRYDDQRVFKALRL
ncbi:MAG: hypothetical protein J6X36_08090 [Lachnospiraceae bacterium]|nr:hypothetical protein [Lachnospiraceae bacterium]